MKVYIVDHVKPNMQVFASYEEAFAFAKVKADKKRPKADIGFDAIGSESEVLVYCPIPWTDNHMSIYEREIKEGA